MGDVIKVSMQAWNMDVSNLQRDYGHPTGSVHVTIEQGEPGYTILAEQAYDYINRNELIVDVSHGFLYHGSLAMRHQVSRQAFESIKKQHAGKLFMDVNLREPWWNKNQVQQWLNDADWVKLNHHELQALQSGADDIKTAMQKFLLAYDLDGLVVTSGEQGARAINALGERVTVKPVSGLQVIDTVGAGDAFAAILLIGLNLGWSLQITMERAQSFASSMVGQRGATVQDINFYRPFLQGWML